MVKQISDNEIYLLIKYIKSVLWRVVKRLSYIEEARCLKVNDVPEHQCKLSVNANTHMNQLVAEVPLYCRIIIQRGRDGQSSEVRMVTQETYSCFSLKNLIWRYCYCTCNTWRSCKYDIKMGSINRL